MDRDQFDLFLERCAKEVDLSTEYGREGAREVPEGICRKCFSRVPKGSRHCPDCGEIQVIPEGVSGIFKPKTIVRRLLAITLLTLDSGVEIDGRFYTRVQLRIQNLSSRRVHISLTYVDSVLIDITGRQHSPVEMDEFAEDPGERLFPTWFYI